MASACFRLWLIGGLLLILARATAASGQIAPIQRFDQFNGPTAMTTSVPGYETRGATVRVIVLSEDSRKKLDRQSLVKLNNLTVQLVSWQTTNDQSEIGFGDLPYGQYDVEVSAVGYLPGHKEFRVVTALVPVTLEITLQKDPAAVRLDLAEATLPARARKDAKHGVSALKSGKWNEANKRLDAAYKLAPSNPDV